MPTLALSVPPLPSLLDETLNLVARRYRVPANASASGVTLPASAATALVLAIEQARAAVARGDAPAPAVRVAFIDALARMIREALRNESADPVFQAMLLRHRTAVIREYASLAAHAERDRRVIYVSVNTIAHPAKQQRETSAPRREALARLHACASSEAWSELDDIARHFLDTHEIADESPLRRGLAQLLESPALQRLLRLEALVTDERVRHYQSLWARLGPRPGSSLAVARGLSAKQRGAAVEALATRALDALARRLNDAERAFATYRVVNSMRVPASIPASHERAKTEWDVVLLRQTKARTKMQAKTPAKTPDQAAAWDVCLLVEAKASADSATTDFPRLLRGLELLAHAGSESVYPFRTQQGTVLLSGASLRALRTDDASLARTVLYCSDAPAETAPRLLSAASRMQLLSAAASLEFAGALVDGRDADASGLEPVWHQLLASPRWRAVLNQYATLRQVRELMVHAQDLQAAVDVAAEDG